MLNECRSCSEDIPNCAACEQHECADCGAPGYYMTCQSCHSGFHRDDDTAPSHCTASAAPCATSMTLSSGECTQIANAIAADIVFNDVPCDNKVWTYAPTMSDVSYQPISVEFVAGVHDDWDSSDPYLIDDRGLWFDGKYDFIIVKGLKVHTKFSTSQWVKPHGSGTLFSVSQLEDYETEQYWAISIKGRKLQFKNTFKDYQFTTANDEVEYYAWQHVGFSTVPQADEQGAITNSFYVNGGLCDTAVTETFYQSIVSDVTDDYMTLIGGYERANVIRGLYQGNIYNFFMESNQSSSTVFSSQIAI